MTRDLGSSPSETRSPGFGRDRDADAAAPDASSPRQRRRQPGVASRGSVAAPTLLVLADRVHVRFSPDPNGDPDEPVDALLLQGGRVVMAGRRTDLLSRRNGADVLDLRGNTITPGLIDSHIHLIEWALARRDIDLTTTATPHEAAEVVAEHAREHAGSWVLGRG